MKSTRTATVGFILLLAACDDGAGINRLDVAAEFEPSPLDFKEVAIQTKKTLPLLLKNTGSASLDIDDVQKLSAPFELNEAQLIGARIAAGENIELDVIFAPTEVGAASATFTVFSDGAEVEVTLQGEGVDRPIAQLEPDPRRISFGGIDLGLSRTRPFTLRNTGNADATINGIFLGSSGRDATTPGEFEVIGAFPLTIEAGGFRMFDAKFAPTTAGPRADEFDLQWAPASGPVSIALDGEGLGSQGMFSCTPTSVDFGTRARASASRVDIRCTALGAPARLVAAQFSPVEPQFRLPAPVQTVDLAAGESVVIPVEFTAQGMAGNYSSSLLVQFNQGMGGTISIPLIGEIEPPPPTDTSITLILRWDSNDTDFDLHFVQPGGQIFDLDDDCYFDNMNPDWGVRGDPADDPFLDDDDTDGFGPEELNLGQTAPGQYRVLVHYYTDNDNGPSTPEVEVFLGGSGAGTYDMPAMRCNEMWHVGNVDWNGTSGTFTPVGAIMTVFEGDCS